MKLMSKRILINISCFYGAFIFGISLVMASPILIEISQSTGRNIDSMGSIFPFFYSGFIIGILLSSTIVNKWNRKRSLSFFYFLLFISSAAMVLVTNYLFFIVIYLLIGLSGGFIESQISSMAMEINKKNEGFYLNLTQVFFGIGAFVGPFIPTFFLSRDLSWKYSYAVVSLICLINLVFFLFLKVPDTEVIKKVNSISAFGSVLSIKSSGFFLLVFAMFFYVCAEAGIAFWIPTFLRLNRSFSGSLAGQVLSYFWLSFVFGRFLTGILSRKIKITNILLVVTIVSIPSILLGIYAENNILIFFAFILAGLLLSGIWPLIVLLGGLRFSSQRDFVVSVVIMAGGVGGLFSPWLIGKVFSILDLTSAMNITYFFLFILLVLIISFAILDKRGVKNDR